MPLTLILGPANSAKAGEVFGAFAAAARRDALLVVPTLADAVHYDRELAGDRALLGRTMTFSALIGEIARRAGYRESRLSSHQRERVLRRVIASAKLEGIGESALTPGFAGAAGQLFAELIRRRITPERFGAAVRAWRAHDDRAGGHPRGLWLLFEAYVRELERLGRVDGDLFAWRALDALRLAPSHWGRTPVFVYGFDDLTPLEQDAIETLANGVGASVTVSLTFEPGRDAFAARATAAQELGAIASEVRRLPAVAEHYAPGAAAALHHVERFLFEPAAPRIDPGEAVRLLEAGGSLAEAELVAAEVLAARRGGVPAEQIAVVCRSLERSGALLARVMRRYGLSVVCEQTIPVLHTAIGRALLGLARCALLEPGEASAEDLLGYLRSPGVLRSLDMVDSIDAMVRQQGLRTAEQLSDAARLQLREIDSLRNARDPGAELARHARRLIAAPHRGLAADLPPIWEREARAAAAVLCAIAESAELGRPLAAAELLELLAGLRFPPPAPASSDAVLIAEPASIRARRFRVVLISGLCADEFPAAPAQDPLLDESSRRELANAGRLALAVDEDPLARERYLLYTSVSRATERLVLSYRSSDEEGRAVLPSPFLDDVAELFVPEWREGRTRRLLADVVWSEQQAPTSIELRYARAAAAATTADAAAAHPAATAPTPAAETRVLGETALRHVRHTEVVSGGALETFAACPVKWLVERQLQPIELAPEAEQLARGNLMHDLLERLIGELGAPVMPDNLDRALDLLERLTAELPIRRGDGGPTAVRAAIRDGIVADLRRYLRAEASDGCDWIPRALELQFGLGTGEHDQPAIELSDGECSVRLRGTIDRVDVEPGGRRAIVRDYKSGANRPSRTAARWLADHELQVGIYMIAVRRLLKLEPVAGFYHPLTGRDLRPRGAHLSELAVGAHAFSTDGLDAAELDELLGGVERDAVALAATLRRGELAPCPATCSRDGCRHPAICWAG
jgi:ATP-dependent helicase/DNAse subunit B